MISHFKLIDLMPFRRGSPQSGNVNKRKRQGSVSQGYEMERKGDLDLILIGLGANLPSAMGSPRETLEAALHRLEQVGVKVVRRSRYWRSRPVPVSDQPWFVNAAVAVETNLSPVSLLACLHRIEAEFGRLRGEVNAARTLDLDLLAYGRLTRNGEQGPVLPHPRMAERAFVLRPIQDIASGWAHPQSGETLPILLAKLPPGQECIPDE